MILKSYILKSNVLFKIWNLHIYVKSQTLSDSLQIITLFDPIRIRLAHKTNNFNIKILKKTKISNNSQKKKIKNTQIFYLDAIQNARTQKPNLHKQAIPSSPPATESFRIVFQSQLSNELSFSIIPQINQYLIAISRQKQKYTHKYSIRQTTHE